MAVRPWCEPSSRLRASACRKPISAPTKTRDRLCRVARDGWPAKGQLRRSARPTQLFHLNSTLAFAAIMKIARPCTSCSDARGREWRPSTSVGGGNGLGRPRWTNENPFYRGRLPLASVRPRFARASPPIRRSHRGRVLFGEARGEFRPHLGANAKHSRGSCSHERQADNTSDKSKDIHCCFPQH
jgi:hypothetical protein